MRDYDRNYDTMTRERYGRDRQDDRGSFFGWNDDRQDSYSQPRYDRSDRYRSNDREGGWFRDRDDDRSYGSDQHRRGVPRDETRRLIASNKVEGTPVYGGDREKLGSIHNFMVEKRSGKVEYAVMKTSSGFLGLDERYYPLNWEELTYDTRIDGYQIDLTEDDLERRRSFDSRGRAMPMESDRSRDDMRYRRDYEDRQRSGW